MVIGGRRIERGGAVVLYMPVVDLCLNSIHLLNIVRKLFCTRECWLPKYDHVRSM